VVEVRRYAKAHHGFDVEDAPERLSTGRGTTMGHDRDAAATSWDEIVRFLSRR
jgi:dienelactone hydrolase